MVKAETWKSSRTAGRLKNLELVAREDNGFIPLFCGAIGKLESKMIRKGRHFQ